MLIYDVILDVGSTGCQQSVSLYQGDDRFKMLRITLLQNGGAYAVASDLNVRLHCVKPDDSLLSVKCGVRGGSVFYLPAASVTDVPGTVRCQLQIRDHGGAVLFSPEFSMEIAAVVPVPELPEGAVDEEYNEEVLSELNASEDGSALLFRGVTVGGIPSASELPENAEEGAVVFLDADGLYRYADGAWVCLMNDGLTDDLTALQTDEHTHANKSALDAVTAEKTASWDGAATDRHAHANKSVLDALTSDVVSSSHTHANKSALDTVTAAKTADWDAAAADRHTHTNKSALNAVTAAKITNWNGAAADRHTHANKSALDAVTAAKITGWDAAAADRHTHANKTALNAVTSAKITSWDAAAGDSHTHANGSALDTVTAEKITGWDAAAGNSHTHANKSTLDTMDSLWFTKVETARADVALLQQQAHIHTNRTALNLITTGKIEGWDAAASEKHSHANKQSLDKLIVSDTYAGLPNASDGVAAVVAGTDSTSKSFAQYDAQTDAKATLRFARQLSYDETAQMDDAILSVSTENDDVGIALLPVYTTAQAQSNPVFGGLNLALATEQSDPKKYMIIAGCDSLDSLDILDDIGIYADDEAEISIFLIYAFENIDCRLLIYDEDEEEIEEGEDLPTLSFSQGWNVFYVVEDGEDTTIGVSAIGNPNVYCDLGTFDHIRQAATQHPFMYDVLQLRDAEDRRGVYIRTDGNWEQLYQNELSGLENRLSVLESGEPDDVLLLGFETYSDLVIRDEAGIGESIQDVPLYVQGEQGVIFSLYEDSGELPCENGVELVELRQNDTGMPLRVLAVTVDGVRYSYFPSDYRNVSGEAIVSAGWNVSDQPTDAPTITNFTPNRFAFGGAVYGANVQMPDDVKSALRSLSQCVNVSAAAMGTIRVQDDAVLRFAGSFEPNRKYMFITGDDCTFTLPTAPWSEKDARFELDLTCTADVELTFPQGTRFARTPDGDTGAHTLTFRRLRGASAWGVDAEDYEEATA